jgi:hypothetical protein
LILLTPPDSVHNWPFICMSSIRHIIHDTENHCCSKEEATPVHGFRSDSCRRREKAEEQCNRNVYQTNHINNWSDNWPHIPRSPVEFVLDWIVPKPFVQDEGDGYHVGGHKTSYNDAYDCVKSGGASNVYESEKKGYDSCYENRV